MKLIVSLVLGILLFIAPSNAVTNLLPDGSFEEGKWKLTRCDHGDGKMEFANEGRVSSKAVKLTGISDAKARVNLFAHSPPIDVKAGQEYVLTLWHRASGQVAPTVSIMAFKEPWAAAQWKTPHTAYETRTLSHSENWSPWTWRFRAAPGTVQLVVAVRCSGIGTVWYDDVALFVAGETRLEVAEAGTITGLPDRRRLKAAVAIGDATRWKLSLTALVTGKQLAVEQGTTTRKPVEMNYSAADNVPLLLALEDCATGAVLATQELAAPPLVAFEMISPRYRDSIYLSQTRRTIRARLKCNADDAVRKGMSFAVQFGERQAQSWKPLQTENDLEIPATVSRSAKSVELSVPLRGVPGRERFAKTLCIVPPAPAGREVIIGDNNETLVDGTPFFPAGFFGPRAGPTFDPIAKAGYTASLTYDSNIESCKRWLDDCQRLGLLGMVSVPHPFVAKFDEAKLRDAIRAVKGHPALLAYYLFDEPSVNKAGQTPADLKRVYDILADEDPYHPIGVCICVTNYFGPYIECYDMVMPDPYPLVAATRPLSFVSQWVDTARAAIGDRKPVWVVPQTFGWDVIENIPNPNQYRTPTPQQERCMTYLALTHGVRAVMYYCYHVYTKYDAAKKKAGQQPYILGGYLPDKQPTLWSALETLGREMRRVGPALLRPGAKSGVEGSVHWSFLASGGKDDAWLIVVNADTTTTARVTLPLKVKPLTTVFGDGKAEASVNGVTVELPPMGTLAATVKH